jgi:hypothetical protein
MVTPGRIWMLWSNWYYYMIRCWVLGTRGTPPVDSGYIDDMSDGDDEDSNQNEESEEEVATAADAWSRCVTTFLADAV